MDDAILHTERAHVERIEQAAQSHVRAMLETGDLEERNAALLVARQAKALRRELEKWSLARGRRHARAS